MDPEQISDDEAAGRTASTRPAPGPRGGQVRSPQPGADATPAVGESRTTGPKVTGPKVTGPKVTGPRTTESRRTEPRTTEPRTTEPRTTESRRTESRDRGDEPGPRVEDPRPYADDEPSARRTAELRPSDPRRQQRVEDPPYAPPRPAPAPLPTNVYRARRPAVAVLLVIPAVAVGALLVRGLAIAAFGETFSTANVIASSLGLACLPLIVAGLYGLITGAAHGAEHWGFRVWARPPLAYLMVGVAFAFAAAVAASPVVPAP